MLTLLAAVATAAIVPQHSIAGVRLQMTQAQVRATLGAPLQVVRGRNDFGPYTEFRYRDVRVGFQGNRRVTGVHTTSSRLRTARGVGVGSTVWDVLLKVPNVKCERIVGLVTCHVGEFTPGKVVTDFLVRDGRVWRVSLGIVLD